MAWPPYVDQRMEDDGVPGLLREIAWHFLNERVVKSGDVIERVNRGSSIRTGIRGRSGGTGRWGVC